MSGITHSPSRVDTYISSPEQEWEAQGGAGGATEDTSVIQFHAGQETAESAFQGYGVIKEVNVQRQPYSMFDPFSGCMRAPFTPSVHSEM